MDVQQLATDGTGVMGTLGFFVPAVIVVALLAGIVVRDRRRDDEVALEQAMPDGEDRPATG